MMKKQNTFVALTAAAAASLVGSASGVTVTLENVDIRGTGVFGDQADAPPVYGNHFTNASGITVNGGAPSTTFVSADPLDIVMTYSNLDLDGDATANDAVTFTMRWEKVDFDEDGLDGNAPQAFDQGIHTGFGNLNDLQVSVVPESVSGTTTDSGDTIVFDGFTGAGILFAGNGDIDSSAEVNGIVLTGVSPNTGSFQFFTEATDFALSPTVSFDNSVQNGIGTIVSRLYDMQFSTESVVTGLEGDYSGDGFVSQSDLDLVLLNWGNAMVPLGFDEANLPGGGPFDNLMSQNELDGVLLNWGNGTPPVTAVPEPTAAALLGLGGLALLRRR